MSLAMSIVADALVVSIPKLSTPVNLIVTAVGSPLMRVVRWTRWPSAWKGIWFPVEPMNER